MHPHHPLRHRALARAAILLATTLAATATPASAQGPTVFTDYDVLIEGSGTYAHHVFEGGAGGSYTEDGTASFTFASHLPLVTFVGDTPGQGSGTSELTVQSASRNWVAVDAQGHVDHLNCSATPGRLADWYGVGVLKGSFRRPPVGEAGIDLAVLGGGLEIPVGACDGPTGGGGPIPLRLWDPDDAFTQFFTFPHEIVGFGKVIQLLSKTVTGADCPGWRGNSVSCELKWSAKVTFERTGRRVLGQAATPSDDDLVVPLPPKGTVGDDDLIVPLPPKGTVGDDDLIVPVPPRARLTPSASAASLSLGCAVACTATLTATPLTRAARATTARATAPLARRQFRLRAGRPTRLTLRLDRDAQRAARRAGGIRLTVAVRTPGGRRAVRRLSVRLPARR